MSDAIAAAVHKAGTKNVVVLSSVGAELPSGTGPVVGLYNLEQKLNQVVNANVLYLHCAYFMENTLPPSQCDSPDGKRGWTSPPGLENPDDLHA